MDKLKWMFELADRITGPANRMANALDRLNSNMGKGKSVFEGSQNVIAGFGGPVGMATGAILGLTSVAIDAATALGSIGYGFAKMAIDTLSFKENTLQSFELMLGTREAADDLFKEAALFARQTPFNTQEVVSSFQTLMASGFSRAETPEVFKALGDVASMAGGGGELIGRVAQQFAQVRAMGKLTYIDFKQITGMMASAGIGQSAVLEVLAKKMRVSTQEAANLISHGGVTSEVGITSIIDTIRGKFGELGRGMELQSKTLSGLFSTLGSSFTDMFFSLPRLENIPGVGAFKGFVQNLIKLLDVGNASGQRVAKTFERMLNSIGGGMFADLVGESGLEKLEGILTGILNRFEVFWTYLEGWGRFLRGLVTGLLQAVGLGSDLAATMDPARLEEFKRTMEDMGTRVGAVLGKLADMFFKLFSVIERMVVVSETINRFNPVTALIDALTSGSPKVTGAAGEMINGVKDRVTGPDGLEMHSPSRVFERYGQLTAQGFEKGILSGIGDTSLAVGQLAAARPNVTHAGNTISVTVSVDARGEDGESLAHRLGELLPGQIAAAFDQLGIEGGTA